MPRLTDALARVHDSEPHAPGSESGLLSETLETRDEPSLLETTDPADPARHIRRSSHTRVQTPPLESPVPHRLRPPLTELVERTFLVPARLGETVRSLMFASVDGADGSLLPAAVAEILLSRARGWICLVDANFRAPILHRHYGSTNALGLIDALVGTGRVSSYARELSRGGDSSLWLMPTGDFSGAGERLLETEAYRRRMKDLVTAFEYVVIGTTIVTADPSAAVLSAQVDGVILVAEANVTTRQALRAAARAVSAAGGRVLGTVLNNRTFPIPEVLYRLL
ncbi:MAG: hypothetical protein ACRD2X_13720 [Vicinamibacteraceae bacterium]